MADDGGRKPSNIVSTLTGHKWTVSGIDFHPTGSMIASASWDRTIRIWDVQEGRELRRLDRNMHTAPITSIRWHPNGALVATTSADNTTVLWDASTGERMRTLREHFGWVLMCSFAPDRTKMATASWDKTVRIWDPNTGELISTLRGHQKGVWAVAFYPVGHTSSLLATGGEDCTARLWDTRTRKVALTLSGGHADAVYDVAWSGDGSLIATTSSDRTVVVWDPKAGKILRMLKGHTDTVKRCAFNPVTQPNGVTALASVGGYECNMWDPTAGRLGGSFGYHDPGKEIECVAISQAGDVIATGSRDGKIVVSKTPMLPKRADAEDNVVNYKERRKTHISEESEGWRDEVRRKKEMLIAASGDTAGKVNETTILSGVAREPPVKGASAGRPVSVHPMLAADGTPIAQEKPKRLGDLTAFMDRQKARHDTHVTETSSIAPPSSFGRKIKEAPEATVGDLMDDNSGLSKQKVRVRQFSIRDPGLGASDDSSLERPTKGHAFANM